MKVILTSLIAVLPFAGMVSLGRMEDPTLAFMPFAKEGAADGCGSIPGKRGPAGPCPINACPTETMPPQYRCNPPGFMQSGCSTNADKFYDKRYRWKWKCPDQPYKVSCGEWFNQSCCSITDPGPSCAGNSGILPCEGTPP